VAMEIVATRLAGPLVGHEGGEGARGRAVVVLLGGGLDVLPYERGLRETVGATWPAPREALRRVDHTVAEQELDHRQRRPQRWQCGRRRGELRARRLTVRRIVAGQPRRETHLDLAELLGVVGDRGEVERAAELGGARGIAVGVVRWEPDHLALR